MKNVYYVGLDIAKNFFQVFFAGQTGRELGNRKLARNKLIPFLPNLSPCTVGIEACGTAHHWPRTLKSLGHEAKLIQLSETQSSSKINGRQMAAYLGLTPKEYSSGGKERLSGITKRGNRQVRTLCLVKEN